MDQQIVRKLEQEIEAALAEIIFKDMQYEVPLIPGRRTMHLMAKAAVTVYESAVENQGLQT